MDSTQDGSKNECIAIAEKLSAAKFAEFASGRFAALCWARAIGQ
jgi:hypothetical protein